MGLANILGSFVYRTSYEDLPPEVVVAARQRILDTIGGAFSVYKRNVHPSVLAALKKLGGRKESTVIGEGVKLPCGYAALLNTFFAYEISDLGPGAHPGCIVIPAALAVAEANSKDRTTSGKDLILAVAMGYEVMGRIGLAARDMFSRGFSTTANLGPLGAAAAASKILGLDEAATINALSISSVMGAGVQFAAKSPDFFLTFLCGRATESGIMAAFVAREGFRGYDGIIEEDLIPSRCNAWNLDLATKGLGKDYMIPKTGLKIHASCGHMHGATDAALLLLKEEGIGASDVERVRVMTHAAAAKHYVIREPVGGSAAKYNPPFCVAAALVFGDTCGDRFVDENLENPQIQEIMRKASIDADEGLEKEGQSHLSSMVEITTKSGKTVTKGIAFPKGTPGNPLTPREMKDKFRRITSDLLDKETTQKFIDFTGKLESAKDISVMYPWLKATKPGAHA